MKENDRNYFTDEHQSYFEKYAETEHPVLKNRIFERHLLEPTQTLIERIVQTYGFWKQLPNMEEQKLDCLAYVSTIIPKYDPTTGKKAFSYFTVVIKNWFFQQINKNQKTKQRLIKREEYLKYDTLLEEVIFNDYEILRNRYDYYSELIKHFENWRDKRTSENDKKVADALVLILRDQLLENNESSMDLIPKKKAINVYFKEITGFESTQKISSSLRKIRESYQIFRKKWLRGDY